MYCLSLRTQSRGGHNYQPSSRVFGCRAPPIRSCGSLQCKHTALRNTSMSAYNSPGPEPEHHTSAIPSINGTFGRILRVTCCSSCILGVPKSPHSTRLVTLRGSLPRPRLSLMPQNLCSSDSRVSYLVLLFLGRHCSHICEIKIS
jgi:hypothetical protein